MKPQKTKNKALELYVTNVPIYQIVKRLNVTQQSVSAWVKKGNWKELKEKNLKKIDENLCETVIKEQMEITRLAQEKLIQHINDDELKGTELVALTKHRLELVRPKQTTNNLNITKNESNMSYQIIIPKEVEELLTAENESIRIN